MNSKDDFALGNEIILNNKRNPKQNKYCNAFRDTTVDSMNNSYNINNNKSFNYHELQQGDKITFGNVEEKYDKYKNLENPFTIPELPRNAERERRSRIINKINKERMSYQSKYADIAIYKNNKFIKRNSYLEKDLFEEEDKYIKIE